MIQVYICALIIKSTVRNAALQGLIFLLCVREGRGSNASPQTGYAEIFRGFCVSTQGYFVSVP